jgi:NAD+ kinase
LVANLDKPRALPVSAELIAWLRGRGVEAVVSREAAALLGGGPGAPVEEMAERVDFLLVLGGDGTLLAAAKRVAARGTPILGINLGHLGFLTEIEEADVYRDLPAFLEGRYVLDERAMLSCTVRPAGDEHLALNDVVVSKGPPARTLRLLTHVDGAQLSAYAGDGVIVSTPTGSTAYALAAGGPVLHPSLAALVVTPICPHTLHSRPTVISARERVSIEADADRGATVLTLDGQESRPLAPGERVEVGLSDRVARLMRRPGWSFYEVVRRKLAEGDAGEGPA